MVLIALTLLNVAVAVAGIFCIMLAQNALLDLLVIGIVIASLVDFARKLSFII